MSNTVTDEQIPVIQTDPRWRAVERVCASRIFAKSGRLRELLTYLARRSISDRSSELTEAAIGRDVFHRGEHYVPSEDSVVRVTVRQLRSKLREYYEKDGTGDDWVVDIPKGGYAPVITARHPGLGIVSIPAPQRRFRPRWLWSIVVLNAILLLVNFVWGARRRSGTPLAAPTLVSFVLETAGRPVPVVASDFSPVLMRGLRDNPSFTLDNYSGWNYESLRPDEVTGKRGQRIFDVLRTHRITRLGDLVVTNLIQKAAPPGTSVVIRHARDISARDFREGSHILLGNPHSTPWVGLFEEGLNFPSTRESEIGFVNREPRPGEPPAYTVSGVASFKEHGPGFARLAVVPNLSGRDKVLLISGVNMVTMEAAGEYASNPGSLGALLKALGAANLEDLPYFEAILETQSFDNTPSGARIVAARRVQGLETR